MSQLLILTYILTEVLTVREGLLSNFFTGDEILTLGRFGVAGIASGQLYHVRPPVASGGLFVGSTPKACQWLHIEVYPSVGRVSGKSSRNLAKLQMSFLNVLPLITEPCC